MKKRLLFISIMLVLFACILAISINAEATVSKSNIDANGDVVADHLGEYSVDNKSYDLSSIDISYLNGNGEAKNGKVYFVTNLYGQKRQMHSTYLPADFDMSQMVYMLDKVDINGDGSFGYSEKILGTQGDRNLYYKYDTYSDFTFTNLVNVKYEIVKLSYSKYLEYFGPAAYNRVPLVTVTYNGREAVEGTFFVSPSVNEFYGGSNGSAFGGSANGNINGETCKFTRLVFEAREHSVGFGQYCFCRNIIEEVVFLGTGTYNLRDDAIAYLWYEGTSTPCFKRVVIQDGVNLTGSIALNVGTYDVIFIGDEENYSYDEYSSCLKNATGNVAYEKICYVYGHTPKENDNICTTDLLCESCNAVLEKANESHTIKTTIEYLNGYINNGEKHEKCTNDGCVYDIVTPTNPLIYFAGISTNKDSTGICIKYAVNKDAIKEYRDLGNTFKYGIVACIPQENSLEVINPDLTNASGYNTISAEMNDNYSAFDFVMRGFGKKHYEMAIVMCAFVSDGTNVDYINTSLVSGEGVSVTQDAYATAITLKSVAEYIPSNE
ncbi:MAG: hypothetical protein J6A95_03045 [Clostridia bacterium]|nr:hypothetical protein [Clostridia bacterium]